LGARQQRGRPLLPRPDLPSYPRRPRPVRLGAAWGVPGRGGRALAGRTARRPARQRRPAFATAEAAAAATAAAAAAARPAAATTGVADAARHATSRACGACDTARTPTVDLPRASAIESGAVSAARRRGSEPLEPNWVGVCVSEQRAPVPRGAVAPCLFVCQLCVSLSVFFLVCVCAQQP
jgi:hypothetical protein